ncbi:unnamed protein product [Arabidopsis lyrata]|uniref:Uncharacterized protein n=1 Tax=Arabidopsis lyrata subsp. lyrata TaxID=81972 RepID=D7M993_ARALL|nr:uncharacterized protein LOC9303271 [Arabidopsis lyrata subsp. lyrata]EFH43458.1 hypothetical protein ARALYDRAFT_913106 [Arabidopsis lyrata subsp. lyrata]CAH8274506.1 unnamed protein product [Arabidopsis lyrata]|eukprot:XP_002867199.1 uncharacterized protein LOC9303271 [Arabidopsis lyrata subsp. lyrata]
MEKKDVSAKPSSVAQSSGTSSSGTAPGPGNMVAPGSGGSHIPRDAFEANTKAYFDNLHAKYKANK